MVWFPVDDAFHSHPKAVKAGDEALGMWARAGSFCMAYLTDGFVPEWWIKAQPKGPSKAKKLAAAGLWIAAEADGERGFQFHDWKSFCTKASILADRRASVARQEVSRNPQLRASIRERDGDVCRYCGTPVEWHNRRGPTGGTYDHVIPDGGTTIANLVVCCRGCNSRKGKRTPEQAGMKLSQSPRRPSSGAKSDLNKNAEISRSVLSPLHSTPLHSNNPLVNLGGELTQVAPPPPCPKHPSGTDKPCAACADARRAKEAWQTAQQENQLAHRRQIRRERDHCVLCDDNGMLETESGIVRCDHQAASNA